MILDGLWQFISHKPGTQHPCSGYILRLPDGALCLIDPPADLTREVALAAAGRNQVARVILTHVQAEHGAGISNFPEATVHVPSGDEYLCCGQAAYEAMVTQWEAPWEWETRGNFQGHLGGAKNERPLASPVSLAASLQAGESVFGFEVVATPGHGKNAVTLLATIDGKRVAFCGDLVYGDGQIWNWFDADWDYGLQGGQKSLRRSAQALAGLSPDLLCPAHGPVICEPGKSLALLDRHLAAVLEAPAGEEPSALNFPDKESLAPEWREITPHIYQWKTGNNVIITSEDGRAIAVDDGLCIWEPLPQRIEKHDAIFREMKTALGISSIDWIIPTHYHGDHTEFIPRLVEMEGARVIALDSMSGPMEFPERYNLACPLPWYGSVAERLIIHEKVPEGHLLRWGCYEFTFFHLGGQTKHHLGVEAVIDGLKVLFVGDAWWGTATAPSPVLCWNEADPLDGGWPYAYARMIEREPDLLVCGHGAALRNPMPYLEAARDAWEARLLDFAKLNPRASSTLFLNPFFEV
jgi:glyoxylase-like metal-dependent hydrolase (beta-lactamase superfamily II)